MHTVATRSATLSVLVFLLLPVVMRAQTATPSGATPATPTKTAVSAGTAPPAPTFAKSPETDYSKEPYVIELLQQNIRFEADGRGQREVTVRARIQSESAVREFGLLVYPFASSFESLDVVYARVRKPDGTVVETPASDVQELDSAVSREAPMYTDEREKHVAIKSLSPGDILEAQLRWTIHDAIAPGHFWLDIDYFKAGICLKETMELNVPRATPLKLHYDNAPVIREDGDRRIYTFQTAHLKKEEESKIPEWETDSHGHQPPALRISSFTSWEEVGAWFSALEQSKVAVTPEIQAKAEELTKGKTGNEDKIRAVYEFVSTHIRYIGVDLGKGRYTPHAAADVLANRYGDCKDKHTLVAALLQAAGISAYPALISLRYRVDATLPSPSLFDHVITAVPEGDGVVFLDTTPEVAPYGLLLAGLRDRQTLVIPSGKAARLVTTPADPPFPSYERFRADCVVNASGGLDAQMSLEDRGDAEIVMRAAYRATAQNNWDELTQKIMTVLGFGGKVSEVSASTPEDTSNAFKVTFKYHRDLPEWKERRMLLPTPFLFLAVLSDEQKMLKDPFPLGPREDITYEATITLPKGFSLTAPENVTQKTDFAEFTSTYSKLQPNMLQGTLHLKTLVREIPGAERTNFSKLATTVSETKDSYIFLEDTGASQAVKLAGLDPKLRVTAGVDVSTIEKSLADHPDNQIVIAVLAQAYIDQGRAQDAISTLEKGLAQKPADMADLHFLLGRAYVALPDGEKAMEEYQKAIVADASAERLNSVASDLGNASLHLPEALSYARQAVKAISQESTKISVEGASRLDFALMVKLAGYWDTAGWIWYRQGDTVGGESYLKAAWDLAQSPGIGLHLAEVYERVGLLGDAARVCSMALAAGRESKYKGDLSEKMEHLQQYLKSATTGPTRAKNVDGSAGLSDMRTFHVPFRPKLGKKSSTAHFVISLTNGYEHNTAVFKSGDVALAPAIAELVKVDYNQSFALDVGVRIIRKATMSCATYMKDCVVVLLPIGNAAMPDY